MNDSNASSSPATSADASPDAATGSRRQALVWGCGALAGLVGAGFAWWRFQPHAVQAGALDALWALKFDTPTGGLLAMQSLKGRPLLINFWATWCPPCVEEMPLLDGFFRQSGSKSWQVIGLAVDQPSAVRKFLERTPVTFPIGLAGLGGTELGKSLGNEGGGLPFTVVIGADGNVMQRKMGKVSPEDLQAWHAAT
jgi:thiol-disulfide isomerase/thioredoxin